MATREPISYRAIALLVAFSVLVGLFVLPRLTPSTSSLVKQIAPEATFPVVANGDPGARMSLADLKGHPVILDFWATWCGPCNLQAPILDRIAKRYESRGLVVLGVNVEDDPELASSFAKKKGLSYPIVTDPGHAAQQLFGVDKLPSLVVIDREGRVASFSAGLVDEGSLDQLIAKMF